MLRPRTPEGVAAGAAIRKRAQESQAPCNGSIEANFKEARLTRIVERVRLRGVDGFPACHP